MKVKTRIFILGLVLGCLAAFPLGVNVGRNEPLLSNPFSTPSRLQIEVVERVKSETGSALDEARESIHKATRPARAGTK